MFMGGLLDVSFDPISRVFIPTFPGTSKTIEDRGSDLPHLHTVLGALKTSKEPQSFRSSERREATALGYNHVLTDAY